MDTFRRRRIGIALALASMLAAVTGLTACTGSSQPDTVRVLALWTDQEAEAFGQILDRFEERTGIQVEYTGGRAVPAALAEAVENGNPPEVAVLSDPVAFKDYVNRGKLHPLDDVLNLEQVRAQYPDSWQTLMRAGADAYVAVVVKATLKSLIWYNPQVFAARQYTPPRTWAELTGLTQRAIRSGGTAPWCLGLEATSDSGWVGTDWIEDILLHQSGPDRYQEWIDGDLPWTSPEVKQAWQRWGQLVGPSAAIDGGARSALITNYGDAGAGLFSTNPGCLMDHQASFILNSYSSALSNGRNVVPGKDFNLFAFPAIDPRYANALEVGADLAGMFNDTPQARSLMAFLATPEAQAIWPKIPDGGALSPNTAVPLTGYGNPLTRNMAQMITGKSSSSSSLTLSFDASDLMPSALKTAFYQGVLLYIADPSRLDDILTGLDHIRARTVS